MLIDNSTVVATTLRLVTFSLMWFQVKRALSDLVQDLNLYQSVFLFVCLFCLSFHIELLPLR